VRVYAPSRAPTECAPSSNRNQGDVKVAWAGASQWMRAEKGPTVQHMTCSVSRAWYGIAAGE